MAREVAEEVGIERRATSGYVASQPWPFPGSLMLGFLRSPTRTSRSRVDPAEITEARWFTRSEIAGSARRRAGRLRSAAGRRRSRTIWCDVWLSGLAAACQRVP